MNNVVIVYSTYLSNTLNERMAGFSTRREDRHPRLNTKQVQRSRSASIKNKKKQETLTMVR